MPSTRQTGAWLPNNSPKTPRHARWVKLRHWIVAESVLTLTFSGFVVLMAHPRLYWGEVGMLGLIQNGWSWYAGI